MPAKLTYEQWLEKAIKIHGDKYDYSKVEYVDSASKVKIICKTHGEFEMSLKVHTGTQKQGCRKCGFIANGLKSRLTLDDFIKRSKEKHGDLYDYSLVEYRGNNEKVKIICPTHGVFEQLPGHHMNGHRCNKCAWSEPSIPKLTTAEWIAKAVEKHGDKFDYSLVDYKGNGEKVKIICPVHGVFEQLANDHTSKGAGCAKCSGVAKFTLEDFVTKASIIHENRYRYDKAEYINSSSKILITCEKHGDFWQTANDHLSCKAGCPSCANLGPSKPELELRDFITSLGFEVVCNSRTILKPYEIDIFIPSKNIGFEFNGIYHHSDCFDPSPSKHKKKTDAAEQKGYRLVHIYSDDWSFNRAVVEKTIKHILGVTEKTVYARNCAIEKNRNDAKAFLTNNHMQGAGKGETYSLVSNGEIVAVMQLSMSVSERGNKDATKFELVRYATSCSVVGGASRLFKAFLKDTQNAKTVVSYSDRDMFDGKMYELLGFEFAGITNPDYKVIVNGRRMHKANFKKTLLKQKYPESYDDTLSEREMCHKLKFYRIYNSGLKKWVFTRH